MLGAQLTEPLPERSRIFLSLSERLQVPQQRCGQVIVVRPPCLDQFRRLLPGRFRPGSELVEVLRVSGSLGRPPAGLCLAPALFRSPRPRALRSPAARHSSAAGRAGPAASHHQSCNPGRICSHGKLSQTGVYPDRSASKTGTGGPLSSSPGPVRAWPATWLASRASDGLDGVAGWFGVIAAPERRGPAERAIGELIHPPPRVLLQPVVMSALRPAVAQA